MKNKIITIYDKNTNKPVINGIIINSKGNFITLCKYQEKIEANNYYLKLLGSDEILHFDI